MRTKTISKLAYLIGLAINISIAPLLAQSKYDPGATDREIKIGQTMPYSGPASAYGTLGRAQRAYFDMINAEGGVNGRKIKLLSLDDGYSPPKTVEMVRKLVEHDEVLFLFQTNGTASNTAIQKYLNAKKIPHLFVASGAAKWDDPQNFPWTMGWQPNNRTEAKAYANYILQNMPNAKIGVLYQNDDLGKDYLRGLQDGLAGKASQMIVSTTSYEVTDPTVDSQIITLKGSGADVFIDITTPKFGAQAIRKTYDIGWRPLHILAFPSSSVATVLTPAGLEKSVGLISVAFLKDPTDPQWANDSATHEYLGWMKKYYPEGSVADFANVYAYSAAQTVVQVLKQCGNELTRENVMKQAANLNNLELPMLLPGIRINTSHSDYRPIEHMQLMKFDGRRWVRFGDVFRQQP